MTPGSALLLGCSRQGWSIKGQTTTLNPNDEALHKKLRKPPSAKQTIDKRLRLCRRTVRKGYAFPAGDIISFMRLCLMNLS
jgi:hypothetical protein